MIYVLLQLKVVKDNNTKMYKNYVDKFIEL
jgi:hypothetical protein